MRLTVFALMALGAYRATRFVTQDTLPPVVKVREFFLHRWGPVWGEVWTCPYCMGWWVSGLVLAATRALGLVSLPRIQALALWLPLAGAQALLNALDDRLG